MKRVHQDYKEIIKIGERHYKDKNFCGVVTCCTAGQASFGKVFNLFKKKTNRTAGKGVVDHQIKEVLKNLDVTLEEIFKPKYKNERITVSQAIKRLPKNEVFIVYLKSHVFCLDRGKITDWIAPTRRHRVELIYKVTRHFKQVK